MSEKKGIELDDQELEKVAGGRWKSVQTDDSTTDDTTTSSPGNNK
ncbi:MAG TPA: hypothetical protein VMV46_03440 [Thermoanaerobaculia bacterium]|nr:hypothetical protein [Thermoanaerobaculia bacterium]